MQKLNMTEQFWISIANLMYSLKIVNNINIIHFVLVYFCHPFLRELKNREWECTFCLFTNCRCFLLLITKPFILIKKISHKIHKKCGEKIRNNDLMKSVTVRMNIIHDQYWQIAYPKFLVTQHSIKKGIKIYIFFSLAILR